MLEILYEDNHIIVVLKPQNVPTQQDSSKDPDMLTLIKQHIKETQNKPGNVFLGLVHRLDRPTGGVMVFAKTSKSASRLSQQIIDGSMKKSYIACVNAVPRKNRDNLVNFLKKDEKNNMVTVVPQLVFGAKRAELDYKTLDHTDNMALLDVNLVTGRSHQIRVQLKHIGHAIYGDAKYGQREKTGKLALWAYCLQFTHPTTQIEHTFKAYPPLETYPWSEFSNTISKL